MEAQRCTLTAPMHSIKTFNKPNVYLIKEVAKKSDPTESPF